jgi:hypothetical protein
LLTQFIGTGRVMTRRRMAPMEIHFRDAAMPWFDPLFSATRTRRPREPMRPLLPLGLLLRRRRRKKHRENEAPAKAWRRSAMAYLAAPARPEDQRRKAIRAAWAVFDWHTLKAFGEIDAIPEP